MTSSEQRIFISDLPEAATDKEIRSLFNKYGKVTSIEIKTRKELTPKNKSYFFAYVNVTTDHHTLNQCFRDFQTEPWHGDYVKLQIAKESFLDRLKREREEDQKKLQKHGTLEKVEIPKETPVIVIPPPKSKFESDNIHRSAKKITTNSEDDSSICFHINHKAEKSICEGNETKNYENESKLVMDVDQIAYADDEPALKIRKVTPKLKINNKIPSFGHEPIIVFNTKREQPKNLSEANLKRLESLKHLKRGYQNEKDLIKNALKNIDAQPKNKRIIFDDERIGDSSLNKPIVNGYHKKKNNLFEEADSDEFEGNFDIEEHLTGVKGKKLLEMQSKFKNDKRFVLDNKFLEDEDLATNEDAKTGTEDEESLESEKQKEMHILEEVLGHKIIKHVPKKSDKSLPVKAMLRFDPTQDNSNFELKIAPEEPKKKKTRKELKEEARVQSEAEKPKVSKEVFYKVSDSIKFEESKGFSLLSSFKSTDNIEESNTQLDYESYENSLPKSNLAKNPFKYDSSDDELEIPDIPHTNDTEKVSNNIDQIKPTSGRPVMWTESFFFKPDDHRLQDGFDFIEKIRALDDKEFSKTRQNLKGVIRTKVRNSERKNRMFRKKLGGSKSNKRKHVRIKKALKR